MQWLRQTLRARRCAKAETAQVKHVIWEIILRDFWGYILRDRQLDSRIILLGRLRLDMSSRHTGSDVFKFISWALYA
jgi:hypothetical protein